MELKWSFSETYPAALSTPDPQDDVAWLRWVIIQASAGKTSEVNIHCKRVKTVNTFTRGAFFRLTHSHHELTKDHVLTNAYVKIFRTVTRNAVNERVWRKKDCSWLPLNKHALNIFIWAQFSENQSMVLQEPEHGSLRIRMHLSWRTGKHLHVLHVLQTYSTCSLPGWWDGTNYATLIQQWPNFS